MNKSVQKKKHFGYALFVRHDLPSGGTRWDQVYMSFDTKYQAECYRAKTYPEIKKWRIEGIRFDVKPLMFTGKEGRLVDV